jgi:hypothetical protein
VQLLELPRYPLIIPSRSNANRMLVDAMSRPTVVITCMLGSPESWLHQQQPYSRHSRAGGGAVHSINSGYCI